MHRGVFKETNQACRWCLQYGSTGKLLYGGQDEARDTVEWSTPMVTSGGAERRVEKNR
jgi:hypothetical protein